MSWSLKNPNPAWRFGNGDYVFHGDGTQIDPSSPEGQQIQAIWNWQQIVLGIDDKQKEHFAWITYPNDPTSRQALLSSWGLDPNAVDPGPQPDPPSPP